MSTVNEDGPRQLRRLLAHPQPLVAPGVYDCLSARVAERVGFAAIMVSGAGVTASLLGLPDIGLSTMTEILTQTRNIVRSVSIPVLADCDTGYGTELNVRRTVEEFEGAGVAGLFIEDQVAPKRCGHFADKQVIPEEEMVQKIRAALDARVNPDLVIIARTDSRAELGIKDALHRAEAYSHAGADAVFLEAPESRAELENNARYLATLGIPVMVNMAEGGKSPLLSVSELSEMGYAIITYPGAAQKSAIFAMIKVLESLRVAGSLDGFFPEKMVSLAERSELLGLPELLKLAGEYARKR